LWNVEQQDSDNLNLLVGWDFKAGELIELGVWKFVGLIPLIVHHRLTFGIWLNTLRAMLFISEEIQTWRLRNLRLYATI